MNEPYPPKPPCPPGKERSEFWGETMASKLRQKKYEKDHKEWEKKMKEYQRKKFTPIELAERGLK